MSGVLLHVSLVKEEFFMLKQSELAPEIDSVNQNNQAVKLSVYKDNANVVLYFYPKDDTPGCTIQANQFTELLPEFKLCDTVVIGVSKDSCNSHMAFINKYELKIDLLADTDGKLCESYGVWQEKEKNGVKKMGIVRSTFLINKSGVLEDVMYGVDPEGHAKLMLEKVKQLQ